MSLAGKTLADRYDILELLGSGGMGEVYRARDRELDDLVALKVIRADLASDALVDRFRHEVKLARRVTHAHVARTFELGRAGDIVYATMELIDGESLTRRLARLHKLPVAEAIAIARAVCDGLVAAHAAGVIHRDIKPDNILIAADGRVVVADFGVAAVTIEAGELTGTAAYMAPEQARGARPTPAADVYAVGVVLFEMLTGRRAFYGETRSILDLKQSVEHLVIVGADEVAPELAEIVARTTSRDPELRPTSADALRRQLAPWSRSGHAAAPAPRVHSTTTEHEIIVVAPALGAGERQYLAEAVHQALLQRLSRTPRVRVRPRITATGATPEAYVVTFAASTSLALEVRRGASAAPVLALDLPLEVGYVAVAAEIAATSVAAVVGLSERPPPDPAGPALDLWLRARHVTQLDNSRVHEAVGLLERAAEIAPQDPRITATLAMAYVRRAFFIAETDPAILVRAARLARTALHAGPDVAEAHLAMGHLELNTADAVVAAAHFRVAIARAPHLSEGHEYLGRMLLEAGYLDQAFARLDEATAIAPHLQSARWEIARAWALEGRWDDYDAIIKQLWDGSNQRLVSGARYALWRGDREAVVQMRESVSMNKVFAPSLITTMLARFLDGRWADSRDKLIAEALDITPPSRRRRAFVAQLVAEAAGYNNDVEAANTLIAHAIEQGLFDLHWLDRCPLLASVRDTPEFARSRNIVKQRAEAILDALYGDHGQQTIVETQISTS